MRRLVFASSLVVWGGAIFYIGALFGAGGWTGDDTPFIGENIPFAEYTKQFGNIRHSRFVFYIAARYL